MRRQRSRRLRSFLLIRCPCGCDPPDLFGDPSCVASSGSISRGLFFAANIADRNVNNILGRGRKTNGAFIGSFRDGIGSGPIPCVMSPKPTGLVSRLQELQGARRKPSVPVSVRCCVSCASGRTASRSGSRQPGAWVVLSYFRLFPRQICPVQEFLNFGIDQQQFENEH